MSRRGTVPAGRGSDSAASSPAVAIVAGVVLLVSIGAVFVTSQQMTAPEGLRARAALVETTGEDIAFLLTASPGIVGDDASWSPWVCDPVDNGPPDRVGLSDVQGGLAPCKVANLRQAPATAASDDWISTSEMAEQFGIGSLHVRIAPRLDDLATVKARGGLDLDVQHVLPSAAAPQSVAADALDTLAARTELSDACSACVAGADVVIVGAHVDHTLMPGAFPGTATFVSDGGLLVILPTPYADDGWLASLWASADATSSGPLAAGDLSHSLMQAPNVLPVGLVAYEGTGPLDIPAHAFIEVGPVDAPWFYISRDGAFGDGTVIVVDVDLATPTGAASQAVAEALLHNVLVHAWSGLWLEYGDEAAPDTDLRAGQRWSTIRHADPYDASRSVAVPVRVTAYVWAD